MINYYNFLSTAKKLTISNKYVEQLKKILYIPDNKYVNVIYGVYIVK